MTVSLLAQIQLAQNKNQVGRVRILASYGVLPWEMLCYGQELIRADYPELFNEIGITFGAGNGTTTFNLPDLRGYTIAGLDNMGGFPAARLTDYGAGNPGINGDVLGSAGGIDRVTLLPQNLPSDLLTSNSAIGTSTGWTTGTGGVTLYQTSSQPNPVPNVQPTMVMNYVINLGRFAPATTATQNPDDGISDEEFNGPFNDWVNVVTDYGADPTGTTDSTVAFQNMINDLMLGREIGDLGDLDHYYISTAGYIPSGTYLISSPIYWPGTSVTSPVNWNIAIYGENPETTILKWTGPINTPILWMNYGGNSALSRVTFDGQGGAGVQGIHLGSRGNPYVSTLQQMRIQDCIFKDLSYGISANPAYPLVGVRQITELSIMRCRFYRCDSYGIYTEGLIYTYLNNLNWWTRQCYFEDCYIGIGGPTQGNIADFAEYNPSGHVTGTATFKAVSVTVSNGGSGYSVNDVLTVVGGTGTATTATVTAVNAGVVTAISLTSAGNYSALPTLSNVTTTVSPSGGTNCTLNLNMGISTITPDSAMTGLTYPPTVIITSTTGIGATATSSVSGGNVSSITITDPGYDYEDATIYIHPIPVTGQFSVYDCIFNASTYFDIYYACGNNCGIRRNFSINSARFLHMTNGQFSIIGNRVVNPLNTDCIHNVTQYGNQKRIIFADNKIKSRSPAVGAIWLDLYNVTSDNNYFNLGDSTLRLKNTDLNAPPLIAWNNQYSVNYGGVFSFDARYTNQLIWDTLTNQTIDVSVPLRAPFPQHINRQTFYITDISTAQQTIDAAINYESLNPSSEPIVYLPVLWAYGRNFLNINIMPLIFPANVKMSFQGASSRTIIGYSSDISGYDYVPYIVFRGPSKVTVKNINWNGYNTVDDNDRGGKLGYRVVFDNIDQIGARIINDNCRHNMRVLNVSNAQVQWTDHTYRDFGDPYTGKNTLPQDFTGNVNYSGNGWVLFEGMSTGYGPPQFDPPPMYIGSGSNVFIRDCDYHRIGNTGNHPNTIVITGNTSVNFGWFSIESSNYQPFTLNYGHYPHDISQITVDSYKGNVVLASSYIPGEMNILVDSSNFNMLSWGGEAFVINDNNIFKIYNGDPINILGTVSTKTSLSGWPSSYTGDINDAYYTADYGHLWVWNGSTWVDVVGLIGAVSTSTSLPGYPSSYTGNLNDAYVTRDTHTLWKWSGSTWENAGGNDTPTPATYYYRNLGQHVVGQNLTSTTPAPPLNLSWYDGAPSGLGGTLPSNYQQTAARLTSITPTVFIDQLGNNITDVRLHRVSGDISYVGGIFEVAPVGAQQIILTSGTTWTVPTYWNNSSNTIECIGAGAGGGASLDGGGGGTGGGGGAYAKSVNLTLTPGSVIEIHIGNAGVGGSSSGSNGANGEDTWFNSSIFPTTGQACGAKGGSGGLGGTIFTITAGGQGGQASSSYAIGVGNVTYNGGNGGGSEVQISGAGGGGGAAGPNGAGANGGTAQGNDENVGSGGGGGSGGGTAGSNNTDITGGTGGNNFFAAGGGANGAPGTNGGGGGGASIDQTVGGAGGNGTEFDNTHGSGGGGGGGNMGNTGGAGGLYGGGGGGGGAIPAGFGSGGQGAQGMIIITYTP